MSKKFQQVYQFKITLKDIEKKIWRRIQVPENYNFWELHCAIQSAMGWYDSHLHEFHVKSPTVGGVCRIGRPDEEDFGMFGREIIEETKQGIKKWFFKDNNKALYLYDFGDGWEHEVRLEKILPRGKDQKYPVCLEGEMACPPEDCGGVYGYPNFLEAISNPKHKEHNEYLEWCGGSFDPEKFDPKAILFDDPDEHWKETWGSNAE